MAPGCALMLHHLQQQQQKDIQKFGTKIQIFKHITMSRWVAMVYIIKEPSDKQMAQSKSCIVKY